MYSKVLLKLSGESLMGDKQYGQDIKFIQNIATQIKDIVLEGISIAIVVGGGNICRGMSSKDIDRASADYMGMLATVINALALQNCLEAIDVDTRVLSALPITSVCEPYIRRKARRHMEKKRVVIFAGGTGNPFFTTDTAAVLRSIEMNCDIILKGTSVDGVYDSDPHKNPNAHKFQTISYQEVLTKNLRVMDMAAVALARDYNMPISIFCIKEQDSLFKMVTTAKVKHTKIQEK